MDAVSLTIDVAGFYYSQTVSVPTTATLMTAMDAAKAKDAAAGAPRMALNFTTEILDGQEYIDCISVHHFDRAESRQDKTRKYDPGIYKYSDDEVYFLPNGNLAPRDPMKSFVLSWQYYCYDIDGRDISRGQAETDRKVVPFSVSTVGDTRLLVWRLVAIFLRPSHGDSLKIARARIRSAQA